MSYDRSEDKVKKYPWLKTMWKYNSFLRRLYFKGIRLIEWYFQTRYGFEEDELLFAFNDGECFGIDWKGCGFGGAHKRGACLVHESDLCEE